MAVNRLAPSLLDLVGNTPLVELSRFAPGPVRVYAKLEAQNPTGSIKDRVAKAMIEAAEASGELEPGRRLLEPTSGNTGISLALVAKLKGYPLTCVMPTNATPERRLLLQRFGAEIVESPGEEGSNGAVRLALELAERSRPSSCRSSTRTRPTRAPTTRAPAPRSLRRSTASTCSSPGLGTGGTLMGTGARLRESFPDVVVAAAEPLPGEAVMGLRSLADGYVPPILDVDEARPKDPRLECGVGRRAERAARERRDPRRRLLGSGRPRRPQARRRARRGRRRLRAGRRRLEGDLGAVLGGRGRRRVDGADRLVVIPAEVRAELRAHAEAEAPNEACGLVVLRDGVAERYVRGRNAAESPYRFELEVPPETWFLEDEGYELAVFHSHLSSPPRPSRTDVENIGLWQGKPYLILSLGSDSLAGWTIEDGRIEPLAVTDDA